SHWAFYATSRVHSRWRYGGGLLHGPCAEELLPDDQRWSARHIVLLRLPLLGVRRWWDVERGRTVGALAQTLTRRTAAALSWPKQLTWLSESGAPKAANDVKLCCYSSPPQVVATELVDRPAPHQLHVTLDFGTEIFKGPFDGGLPRARQGIQIKPPARTCFRAYREGLQDVGATGEASVASHIS